MFKMVCRKLSSEKVWFMKGKLEMERLMEEVRLQVMSFIVLVTGLMGYFRDSGFWLFPMGIVLRVSLKTGFPMEKVFGFLVLINTKGLLKMVSLMDKES